MDYVISDNIACIRQAVDLLDGFPSDVYCSASEASLGASVGGHIRHNIDHYSNFIAQARSGSVDYDTRSRDPQLECDPSVARQQLDSLALALAEFSETDIDLPLQVTTSSGSTNADSGSTLRRELQFLLSHSIHHYAIIAMICRMHEVEIPADFGVAPSTLQFRQQQQQATCAH